MEAILNGNNVYYIEKGDPASLPVVLVHGMMFNHHMWDPQIEALSKDYRVIAYDIRGHGKSGVAGGQYTYRMFVEDLRSLLDHLQIDQAVICGLSMGGAVSLRFVELYPHSVRALVICDTTSKADTNEAKYRRENAIHSIKRYGMQSFVDGFVESVLDTDTLIRRSDLVALVRNMILTTSPVGACGALLAQAARTDTSDTLERINMPAMVIVGERDSITPPDVAQSMHQRIPNSEFHVIPDAAHVTNLENPEVFNEHLTMFLEKLE